jgi:hypothetical protein
MKQQNTTSTTSPLLTVTGNAIQTHTGKFDITNYTLDDINIFDISRSLSNTCRYNGHVCRFYSVAEHSILSAVALDDEELLKLHYDSNGTPRPKNANSITKNLNALRLGLLLHDAAEAYIGDTPRPIKAAIASKTKIFEKIDAKLSKDIFRKYGIAKLYNAEYINNIDNRMLFTEKRDLKPPADWGYTHEPFADSISPSSTTRNTTENIERIFLSMFAKLTQDENLKKHLKTMYELEERA